MAGKGTYAAYKELTPIKEDFGELAEAGNANKAAQTTADAEARAARQKRRGELTDSFKTDYATLTDVITNTKSIDQAFARGINSARDEMGSLYKDMQSNPTMANNVDVQLKVQNLKRFSKNLAEASKMYTEYGASVAAGVQDGTLSSWMEGTLNQLDSVFRQTNLDIKVDSRGNAIALTYKVDSEGEPVLDEDGEKIIEEINLSEILDGRGLEEQISEYKISEEAQKIGKDLGKREEKKPDGSFSHYSKQAWEDIEGDARGLVKGYIGTAKNPTPIAKSIWSDTLGKDKTELTEADMQEIEDTYLSTIKTFYDVKDEREVNVSARTSAANSMRTADTADKDRAANGSTGGSGGVEVRTTEDGDIIKDGITGVSGDLGGASTSFTMPKLDEKGKKTSVVLGTKGDETDVKVLHLTDAGKIVYEGAKYVGKTSGKSISAFDVREGKLSEEVVTKEVGGGINPKDANEIARQIYSEDKGRKLKDAGELKEYLENKEKAYKEGRNTSKGKDESKAAKPARNTISMSEIKERVKGSGYTVKEYIKLLKGKGVDVK
ncbi:structural protein [Cellulophaga phage Calle_1]|uniref:Structural protein n=1 Tax=Cellulophaga phage Calle_1 TaxID=2745643 RepID=A0A8E4ZB12_9CAUD|nr:structural protein [Cellulophaga phage Calle_1]QQV89728.1 structural protein [Cellulophaga phage Calle_1]QQV89776.1 structural protein [Cellulophaga phage Calle_2]QQV89943.1 structural protein [Cellulophaga phage Calle_3]